ncbi:MAG: hypothetical protein CL610_02735 [Anaerolineaceae bacterium]|nr:hypothetical protein [Anaerolineaceae bacterium]
MNHSPFVSLEKIIKRAPLGLRFKDLARGDVNVVDSLDVRARQRTPLPQEMIAQRSPVSGIYGFRSLPGLRDYEWGLQPASNWCTNGDTPEDANFVITVRDNGGRFLPQVLLLCLPKEAVFEVELVSGPTREPLAGYAVVRGEVWDRAANAPASWAVIIASPGDYATVADVRGLFALYLPFPTLDTAPDFGDVPVTDLVWPLTFQVLYEPSVQSEVLADWPPHTASIAAQAAASVFDTTTTGGAGVVRSLQYGQPLILATQGQSRLLVNPA